MDNEDTKKLYEELKDIFFTDRKEVVNKVNRKLESENDSFRVDDKTVYPYLYNRAMMCLLLRG